MMELENIAEELAIGFRVGTVKDDVRAGYGHTICR